MSTISSRRKFLAGASFGARAALAGTAETEQSASASPKLQQFKYRGKIISAGDIAEHDNFSVDDGPAYLLTDLGPDVGVMQVFGSLDELTAEHRGTKQRVLSRSCRLRRSFTFLPRSVVMTYVHRLTAVISRVFEELDSRLNPALPQRSPGSAKLSLNASGQWRNENCSIRVVQVSGGPATPRVNRRLFAALTGCALTAFTGLPLRAQATLAIVSQLSISPTNPEAGQRVEATFTVINSGNAALTVPELFVGCRDSSGRNLDFAAVNEVILLPGEKYVYTQSLVAVLPGTYVAWPVIFVSGYWVEIGARESFSVKAAPGVDYTYMPPAQTVSGGGSSYFTVASGHIHQTDWNREVPNAPDIQGVYVADYAGWRSMVWRWADTMRANSITRVTASNGKPAYRMELTQDDESSPGTKPATHPRAELFSVDPAEDRREPGHTPSRDNIFRDGDEYWATFAIYLPAAFPTNHRWATLIQRKLQNLKPNEQYPMNWFTLNVHKDIVDLSIPGLPLDTAPMQIGKLSDFTNRWNQITIHERLSSKSDGLFEVYLNGAKTTAQRSGRTVLAGDWNFNYHYGYYRANEPADGRSDKPGVGVVEYSPLLVFRGSSPAVPPMLP